MAVSSRKALQSASLYWLERGHGLHAQVPYLAAPSFTFVLISNADRVDGPIVTSRYSLMSTRHAPAEGVGSECILEFFHPISEEQYSAIGEAMRQVREFAQADLLPYVQHSVNSLLLAESQLDQQISLGAGLDFDIQQANLALSCGILTALSAIVLHQEQTLKKISKIHGSPSSQLAAAKEIFAAAYDDNYSYRFCYKLRQFIMHRSMHSLSISALKTGDARMGGLIIPAHSFEVYVARDVLLAESDVWTSALRQEIQGGPEKIYIIPHIEKANDIVGKVSGRTRELVFPGIRQQILLLRELQSIFAGRAGAAAAAEVPEFKCIKPGSVMNLPQVDLDFSMTDTVEDLLSGSPFV